MERYEDRRIAGKTPGGGGPAADEQRQYPPQAGRHYYHRLCSLICNGNDVSDMEDFGEARQAWLQQFLELPQGIPDSDTFRRVFERLNPSALAECLYDWLGQHRPEGSVIAVDGKTICGSKSENHKAYHVVSAFVAENQLTLGEVTADEKSNEITAVPELLDLIDIKGSINHNGGRHELPERNRAKNP